MPTYRLLKQKCGVCGKENKYNVLVSTNSFGYMDLDIRPALMARVTMLYSLQVCPHCGYVSYDIKKKVNLKRKFFESKEYNNCQGNDLKDTGKYHYQNYMIYTKLKDYEKAARSILVVAWLFDDKDLPDEAIKYRKIASKLYKDLISMKIRNKNQIEMPLELLVLVRIDILRRAGLYDTAIKEYNTFSTKDKIINNCIKYELYLCRKKDTNRYTVGDAVDYANSKKVKKVKF